MSTAQGFGFFPEKTHHCFVVHFPASPKPNAEIAVTEEFTWSEELAHYEDLIDAFKEPNVRVLIPRRLWDEVAEETKAEFNRRLIRHGVKSGKWFKNGMVPVDRNLGKELVLLLWAIEDADPLLVPHAVRNWLGLSPEERWWLYTMTNAATGQALSGRNKGWRKAVRFALTENPIADSVIKKRNSDFELTLFQE